MLKNLKLIMFILATIIILTGCGKEKIVGTWKEMDSNTEIEFKSDKTAIIYDLDNGSNFKAKYSLTPIESEKGSYYLNVKTEENEATSKVWFDKSGETMYLREANDDVQKYKLVK